MHILVWICSALLIAEFIMAPINLWTGHTMANFRKFTGLPPQVARVVFAPVKLVGALLVLAGFFAPTLGKAGAVVLGVVCAAYLVLLASPKRRDPSGVLAFAVGLAAAVVVFLGR